MELLERQDGSQKGKKERKLDSKENFIIRLKVMNPEAQKELDRILTKPIEELKENEKAFLRARISYFKPAQLEEYKSILEPKPPKAETGKQNAKSK